MTAPVGYPLTFFPVTGHWYAVADPAISGHENKPEVEPVNGLVTFTPRLKVGQVMFVDDFLVTTAYDSLQTITIINNPNSGLWTVNVLGTWTDDLAWNISNADLQTALITAAGAAAGDLTVVTGLNPQSYDVQFANGLGGTEIPKMVADPGTLMNAMGQTCAVSVAATDLGTPEIVKPTGISIPPLTARIWFGELSTIDYEDTPGFQLVSNTGQFGAEGDGWEAPPGYWYPPAGSPLTDDPDKDDTSTLPELGLGYQELIYDVTFSKVTYNGQPRHIAPWAFVAPNDDREICLTDPDLLRYPWMRPIDDVWSPPYSGPTLVGGSDWRSRAAAEAESRRPRKKKRSA